MTTKHALWFPLPMVESHLRSVVEGTTWLADKDLVDTQQQ